MKKEILSEESIIDVTLYKTIKSSEKQRIREMAEAKGWKVKFGKEKYLKQANGF